MNIIKILSSITFIKNLFCILFVGLIMTLYEYALFYFILTPNIKNNIYSNIEIENFNDLDKDSGMFNGLNNFFDSIKDIKLDDIEIDDIKYILENDEENREGLIKDIQYTYYDREQQIIKNINGFTVIAAIIMIIFLISLLLFLRYILIKNNSGITKSMIFNIILTCVLLFIMQGLFYLYGNNFKFPGLSEIMKKTYGPKILQPKVSGEILLLVYDKLLENTKLKE
jgi:hypothetical protein